ncbi:uncharacterized protein VDAG_07422 [Verticillium dahliae VdLs.17]|uniref:Uncharacterized protein n=1 Tax=Verticillium dahliae (strain VdLs.17 / ATCC MYA-4575 / FGSC 10137) TaxID=498257 RepID=G2XAU1_VERDV|nr:uncharacterized protein VDAG_07422 [Verticillium dahliae VdLs.17]EGY16258.1 hypothetical protein VDAG_07422 [Verticillium dahliae VdLs.17]KAH6702656.1 hypothetical protein EV126DRAFT_459459 [Verticillium dahliae]
MSTLARPERALAPRCHQPTIATNQLGAERAARHQPSPLEGPRCRVGPCWPLTSKRVQPLGGPPWPMFPAWRASRRWRSRVHGGTWYSSLGGVVRAQSRRTRSKRARSAEIT